jgi:hypothetical protein
VFPVPIPQNGAATSSSPFHTHSHGDEDIATPRFWKLGSGDWELSIEGRVPSPGAGFTLQALALRDCIGQ